MSIEADSDRPAGAATAEDLLEHAAWVRGVAYALVKDAATADDLVQETWLAALRRPPADDRPVRPWLAGVVRNLARQSRRGDARRRRREEVVATRRSAESLPTPDELTERVETQQRLVEHVKELDEPFRSTILLRYFEGLSAAEIARRDGVPAGTVRWRLSRATDLLRDRLDAAHDGDRRAWVLTLIPLAATAPQAAPPTGADRDTPAGAGTGLIAAAVQGVVAMGIGAKLVLGGVAVAALAFLAISAVPPGPDFDAEPLPEAPVEVSFRPEGEARRRNRGPADEKPAGNEETGARGAEETVTPPDRKPPAQLQGRVIDERGRPLGGVRILGEDRRLLDTKTGADGRLDAAYPVADGMRSLDLSFSAEGRVTVLTSVPVVPGETAFIGDITLAPGGSVSGRVVDRDGKPVAGAWVGRESGDDLGGMPYGRRRRMSRSSLHEDPVTETAKDGTFTLTGVPVGEMRVWAGRDKDFLATLSGPLEVRAGQESYGVEVALDRLPPEDLIAGVVLSPDGKPVPRARVRYEYGGAFGRSGSGSILADHEGRFRLVLSVPATYRLAAQDRDEVWGTGTLEDVEGGQHDVQLRLPENRYVALEVTDGAGRPIPSFKAMVKEAESIADFELTFADRSTQRPLSVRVPGRDFEVSIEADGYDVGKAGPFSPDDLPAAIRIELRPIPVLTGRVLRDGAPVEGARVTIHRPVRDGFRMVHNDFQTRWQPSADEQVETAKDGRFRVTLREPNRFVVRVEHDGSAPAESTPFDYEPQLGWDTGDIALTAGGSIEGVVANDDGSNPTGTIVGISRGDGHPRSVRVGPDGRYRFDRLTPGDWEVRRLDTDIVAGTSSSTSARGSFSPTWNCVVREGAVTRHDLGTPALAAVRVAGRITVDGAPVRRWAVSLMDAGRRGEMRSDVVTTDADGRFAVDASQAGTFRVLIRAPGRVLIVTRILDFSAGTHVLDLALTSGRLVVKGVPTVADDAPSPRHALVQEVDGWTTLALLRADETGRAVVETAPAGPARIALHDPTQGDREPSEWETVRRVTIAPASETTLDLSNPEGDGEN